MLHNVSSPGAVTGTQLLDLMKSRMGQVGTEYGGAQSSTYSNGSSVDFLRSQANQIQEKPIDFDVAQREEIADLLSSEYGLHFERAVVGTDGVVYLDVTDLQGGREFRYPVNLNGELKCSVDNRLHSTFRQMRKYISENPSARGLIPKIDEAEMGRDQKEVSVRGDDPKLIADKTRGTDDKVVKGDEISSDTNRPERLRGTSISGGYLTKDEAYWLFYEVGASGKYDETRALSGKVAERVGDLYASGEKHMSSTVEHAYVNEDGRIDVLIAESYDGPGPSHRTHRVITTDLTPEDVSSGNLSNAELKERAISDREFVQPEKLQVRAAGGKEVYREDMNNNLSEAGVELTDQAKAGFEKQFGMKLVGSQRYRISEIKSGVLVVYMENSKGELHEVEIDWIEDDDSRLASSDKKNAANEDVRKTPEDTKRVTNTASNADNGDVQ